MCENCEKLADALRASGLENQRLRSELDEVSQQMSEAVGGRDQWRKTYLELKSTQAENERLKQELEEVKAKYDELKSYLPKVPTQAYEKELAKELALEKAKTQKLVDEIMFAVKYLTATYEQEAEWCPEKQMLLSFRRVLTEFNSDKKDGE